MKNLVRFFLLAVATCMVLPLQGQKVLNFLSTYKAGSFDEGAAEIVAYDPGSQQLFVTNAETGTMDILDISTPDSIKLVTQVDVSVYGEGINSVAVADGVVAAAIEGMDQMPGKIVLFQPDGTFIAEYAAGTLPDMVVFSADGNYVMTANEGEPSDDYATDPEGSITVVDITSGAASGVVTQIAFTELIGREMSLRNAGVRIYGPNANAAQDLEPEYISMLPGNDSVAAAICQENNALVVFDYKNGTLLDVLALGYKNHNAGAPSLDLYDLSMLPDLPELGTPVYTGPSNTGTVMLGGFSGMYYDGTQSTADNYVFYAIPDRGPNDGAVNRATVFPETSQNVRPFKLPNYQGRIVKFSLDVTTGTLSLDSAEQIFLTHPDGRTPISGRGNAPGIDEVPVTYTSNSVILFEDFGDGTNGLGAMNQISLQSNQDWFLDDFNNDYFAEVNAFGADTSADEWLLSPALDLTTAENPVFSFTSTKNFDGDGLEILISTDYDGVSTRPDTFTWANVTAQVSLSPGGFADTYSGPVYLDNFATAAIYIAFHYTSTGTGGGDGSLYQIDDIYVGEGPFANIDYVGEGPDSTQYHALEYDIFGGDFEGIVRDGDGNFWMCDEYRPAIYKFSPEGVMMDRFIAAGTKARVQTEGIFFSEYAEGSSNNKYLEIYNGTSDTVNLEDYLLVNCSNGCDVAGTWDFNNSSFFTGHTIAPQDVFVIAHPSAQADILAQADTLFQFLSNGDDYFAILNASDSSIVDQVGEEFSENDPGSGWDVAGVAAGTQDQTLIRKHYILSGSSNWASAAGTDSINSEWIVEERPTADTVLASLGSHMDYGTESLPEVYSKRRANRGFEALALDTTQGILYAFIQSPIETPGSAEVRNQSDVIRILGINPATGTPVSEYVYLLEKNRDPNINVSRVDKIGDAVFVGDNKFWVLERDSEAPGNKLGKKFIYEIDLKGATNILGTPLSSRMDTTGGLLTLEMLTANQLADSGIVPVFKYKVLNLPTIGYETSDKPEGISWIPGKGIAVLNDNDFGLNGAGVSDVSGLGIIEFGTNFGLDASNDDGVINIQNHPVLGMYQPDAITAAEINGATYIFTANEGDSRDYDGYSEEERGADVVLDAGVFANPPALQDDAVLGRIKITSANGNLDGDDDFDRLFTYGARSFGIWDAVGNLVWDSGDEFEQVIATQAPAAFNSTNDDNDSFDNRSDDKGPEPEAITVVDLDTAVYAFIGLERMGGIMVYNVSNPAAPEFREYELNRDFSVDATLPEAGDLAPEDIKFISADDSPNGIALIAVANEVSGTVTLYQLFEAVPVGINSPVAARPLYVFPNPINGGMLNMSEIGNYQVFNMVGQQVARVHNSNRLDVTNLQNGVYIIRSDRNQAVRFIKR